MSRARMGWARRALPALAVLWPLMSAPTSAATQLQDGAWSALDPAAPAPGARRECAAIYDAVNQRYLIFAGFTNIFGYYQLLNEVWTASLPPGGTPTWDYTEISGPVPGPRHSPQWGYDPARNRLLIFGGYGEHHPGDPFEYLSDVWQLSLSGTPKWTELTPAGMAPEGRLAGAAVYDPLRQRFVGFGGTRGLPVDTWVLELAHEPRWSQVPIDSVSPPGSYGMTAIYDPIRDRMVIFGGSTSDDYYGVHNDVWELDLTGPPTWSHLAPGGTLPIPRRSGTAIYDPLRDRMILYGGWDSTENGTASFLGDTWALSFPGNQWAQLSPAGTTPAGRDAPASAIYDPLGDRMVLFGGWSGVAMLGDTEFLTWGGVGTAASVTANSQADPDAVHLQWSVENATGTHAAVYRRDSETEWTSIATVEADASGVVTYDDPSVVAGGQYDYLLLVFSQRGETLDGEALVDVPAVVAGVEPGVRASFALDRVRPNPVADRFEVSFSLPGSEPARLELLDLNGRRVFAREVGSLGAGSHHLEIGGGRDFSPGMYFLRLEQSGRSLVTRVVMLGGPGAQ